MVFTLNNTRSPRSSDLSVWHSGVPIIPTSLFSKPREGKVWKKNVPWQCSPAIEVTCIGATSAKWVIKGTCWWAVRAAPWQHGGLACRAGDQAVQDAHLCPLAPEFPGWCSCRCFAVHASLPTIPSAHLGAGRATGRVTFRQDCVVREKKFGCWWGKDRCWLFMKTT